MCLQIWCRILVDHHFSQKLRPVPNHTCWNGRGSKTKTCRKPHMLVIVCIFLSIIPFQMPSVVIIGLNGTGPRRKEFGPQKYQDYQTFINFQHLPLNPLVTQLQNATQPKHVTRPQPDQLRRASSPSPMSLRITPRHCWRMALAPIQWLESLQHLAYQRRK